MTVDDFLPNELHDCPYCGQPESVSLDCDHWECWTCGEQWIASEEDILEEEEEDEDEDE